MPEPFKLQEKTCYRRADGTITGPLIKTEKGFYFDPNHEELYADNGCKINPSNPEEVYTKNFNLINEYFGDDEGLCQCDLCKESRKSLFNGEKTPLIKGLETLYNYFDVHNKHEEVLDELPLAEILDEDGNLNFFEVSIAEQTMMFSYLSSAYSHFRNKLPDLSPEEKANVDGYGEWLKEKFGIKSDTDLVSFLQNPLKPILQRIGKELEEVEKELDEVEKEQHKSGPSIEFYNGDYEDDCLWLVMKIERLIRLFNHHKNIEIQIAFDGDWTMLDIKVLDWLFTKMVNFYDNQIEKLPKLKPYRININKFII